MYSLEIRPQACSCQVQVEDSGCSAGVDQFLDLVFVPADQLLVIDTIEQHHGGCLALQQDLGTKLEKMEETVDKKY